MYKKIATPTIPSMMTTARTMPMTNPADTVNNKKSVKIMCEKHYRNDKKKLFSEKCLLPLLVLLGSFLLDSADAMTVQRFPVKFPTQLKQTRF